MRIWCLFILIIVMSGCDEDESSAPAKTFAVAIDNRVSTSYDVYKAVSETGSFTKIGHAPSGMTYWIRGLDVHQTSRLRLVPPAGGIDDYHYERNVASTGADVIWVIQ